MIADGSRSSAEGDAVAVEVLPQRLVVECLAALHVQVGAERQPSGEPGDTLDEPFVENTDLVTGLGREAVGLVVEVARVAAIDVTTERRAGIRCLDHRVVDAAGDVARQPGVGCTAAQRRRRRCEELVAVFADVEEAEVTGDRAVTRRHAVGVRSCLEADLCDATRRTR